MTTTTKFQDLSDATFDEAVRGADRPVLVDFWAEWCGPCHAVEPVLQEIAAEHPDEIQMYRLNADDFPGLAGQFGVMGLPTMLVFDDGELVQRIVGAKGKARMLQELDGVLSAGS